MSNYATAPSSTALRLRCLAQRIHDLGPAPLFHVMCELAAGADPLDTFERYGGLPAEFLRAYGGDTLGSNVIPLRFPSS
jgi:hypothetical protein